MTAERTHARLAPRRRPCARARGLAISSSSTLSRTSAALAALFSRTQDDDLET